MDEEIRTAYRIHLLASQERETTDTSTTFAVSSESVPPFSCRQRQVFFEFFFTGSKLPRSQGRSSVRQVHNSPREFINGISQAVVGTGFSPLPVAARLVPRTFPFENSSHFCDLVSFVLYGTGTNTHTPTQKNKVRKGSSKASALRTRASCKGAHFKAFRARAVAWNVPQLACVFCYRNIREQTTRSTDSDCFIFCFLFLLIVNK